ncbi:hypothetical protein BAU15_09860 [Enterococcus sp. JM4C]|uniref:class I SAM-dependent methyltransferase n=1 Tax=Candidatus Enterococcus huntleyi TaxID=1857217 RepID=UPI00137B1F48|nr:class I SAM-dependent methyltransferase [Enterococcus sp. JM4C]KAF1298142.1 hypothetical protein BAU15_09860 [Enterococcus sp. JM4C]
MEEIEAFWDDFADEYAEIQRESILPLSTDVTDYLKELGVFPAHSFLDLAGGAGRYLLDFSKQVDSYTVVDISGEMLKKAKQMAEGKRENCLFIHEEMTSFFELTADNAYEYSFSAMNPGIQTLEDLLEMDRISERAVFIFRMTENQDSLFSRIERTLKISPEEDLTLLSTYQTWLQAIGIKSQTKSFTYQSEEKFTRAFIEEYYEEYAENQDFQVLLAELFSRETRVISQTTITFTLLYWQTTG